MDTKEEIKILDVIRIWVDLYKKNSYYLILDRMPEFYFERIPNSKVIIASDSGFYDTLAYSNERSAKGFAGREFDIKFKDNTVIRAKGDWWSAGQDKIPEPYVGAGIATEETLKTIYVFYSGYVSKKKLDDWLKSNKPSEDYYKYRVDVKKSS